MVKIIIMLALLIIISFFEVSHLLKQKNKKEAIVYLVITAFTIILAMFMILSPQYESLSEVLFRLLKIKH